MMRATTQLTGLFEEPVKLNWDVNEKGAHEKSGLKSIPGKRNTLYKHFLYKGPDSSYFQLPEPFVLCRGSSVSCCSTWTAIDHSGEWVWQHSKKTV